MNQEGEEFRFPPLFRGCFVDVSNDPSWSDTTLGIVLNAKRESADILCIYEGGIMPRRDCWHEDDPRCTKLAHVFDDGDRGVFRLAEGEVRQRQLMQRLGGLESMLEKLVEDVELLKRVNPSREPEPKPTRKRRSPPARTPETAGV